MVFLKIKKNRVKLTNGRIRYGDFGFEVLGEERLLVVLEGQESLVILGRLGNALFHLLVILVQGFHGGFVLGNRFSRRKK